MTLHPEFGDFNSPETMDKRGLEYYIPLWLASLKGWLKDGNTGNARSFVNYLDRAFVRAGELKLLKYEFFQKLQQDYQVSRAQQYQIIY